MATIKISQLPPAPNGTGSGSSKGTDLFPATDVTDTSSSASGTTNKYTLAEINNFFLTAQGLTTYTAALVATTGALTVTYSNGTLGVGATLTNATTQAALTVDGVLMTVGNRVLVWQQASTFQNGIYVVTTVGTGATNWVMTRATDYDQASEIIQYGVMLVNQGSTYAGKLFEETGAGPFTIGTTPITFALYTNAALQIPVLLSQGGTSASLTASNGGIFYSTASAGAILSGTATAGQIIQSGASSAPAWSTTTYPATNAINTIMYASSANVLGVITPVNDAALVSNGSGVPSWQALSAGQILIGTTAGAPAAAAINSGSGIVVANSSGSITISATGGGIGWVAQASTPVTAAINTGYIITDASTVTLTLPTTAAVGSVVRVVGQGAGGWILAPGAAQTIKVLTASASTSVASTEQYDCIEVVCVVANTTWVTMSFVSTGFTIT